jgi:hypothetical protein
MTSIEISKWRENYLTQWLSMQPTGSDGPPAAEATAGDEPTAADLGIPAADPYAETEPVPGEIRLFGPEKVPRAVRPFFVAVLGPWSRDMVAATPFSQWPVPALPGELLVATDQPPLQRVLCVWNTRSLPIWSFHDSWSVGRLADEDLRAARKVFQSLVLGKPLTPELLARTGPNTPGIHEDILGEYFSAERALLADLQSEALEHLQIRQFLDSLGEDTAQPIELEKLLTSVARPVPLAGALTLGGFAGLTSLPGSSGFLDIARMAAGAVFATAGSAKVLGALAFDGAAEKLIARVVGGKSFSAGRLSPLPVQELIPLHLSARAEKSMAGQWRILDPAPGFLEKLRGFLLLDRQGLRIVGKGTVLRTVATLVTGDFSALGKLQEDASRTFLVFHQ